MVEEDRYCIDIVTQISAVRAALRRAEEEILKDHVASCVEHAIASGDKGDQRKKIAELMAGPRGPLIFFERFWPVANEPSGDWKRQDRPRHGWSLLAVAPSVPRISRENMSHAPMTQHAIRVQGTVTPRMTAAD